MANRNRLYYRLFHGWVLEYLNATIYHRVILYNLILDRKIICVSAPGVPESIDNALGNHTRIILMVCDPIERAQVDYFEITSGVDNRHNEWRQKIEAVGVKTFDDFTTLYIKYLKAIMANPSQIENINSYEDFVENIATIRPGMVSFDIYTGK